MLRKRRVSTKIIARFISVDRMFRFKNDYNYSVACTAHSRRMQNVQTQFLTQPQVFHAHYMNIMCEVGFLIKAKSRGTNKSEKRQTEKGVSKRGSKFQ